MSTACAFRPRVDAHFAQGSAAGDRALFEHLPGCAPCRARYERHLVLEQLDPEAPGRKARLQRGVAKPERARAKVTRWIPPAVGALALAAGAVIALGRGHLDADSPVNPREGFHARGGLAPAPAPRLEVYRLASGAYPARVAEGIAREDELAFAYANPGGKKRLLVFAADARRRVYWYYPAWTRPEEAPEAIPIATSATLVELGDAVVQSLEGPEVVLHAVFTDEPLTVRDVEARVLAAPPLARDVGIANAVDVSRVLEVH